MSDRRSAVLALLCALAGGCGQSSAPLVDGGVRRELVSESDVQIGLGYGESKQLVVRYEEDDAAHTIVRGPVRFSIFDDPGGSTLSGDTVQTDRNGDAQVTLTAGSQERSFHVHASAAGASDVVFAVSTSALKFVALDAVLTDPLPQPGTRSFAAALFPDVKCVTLPPSPTLSGEDRSLTAGPAAQATLSFQSLLSRTYAIVGRLEDAGRLVAYGCVDVDVTLVPPGAYLSVPVALVPVSPDVTGSFQLTTALASPRSSRSDDRFSAVDIVDRCAGHAGQLLLDTIAQLASPSRAALIASQRGTAAPSTVGSSTVSCRPALVGAADSLDAQLGALLEATSDGAQRTDLLSDLDAILQSGSMTSTLALAATLAHADDTSSTGQRLEATHTALTVAFSLGMPIDLHTEGLSALVAGGIAATASDAQLTLAPHVLGIQLPSLWGAIFSTAVATRLPALTDATFSGWLVATVAAVQHGGKTGCAAVEDLLCEQTGTTGCAGTLVGPCTSAVATAGDALEASFTGDDALSLDGTCTLVDSNADLVTDALSNGVFTAAGPITGDLAFSGTRGM